MCLVTCELMDKPLMLPIVNIVDENPYVKTFFFDYPLKSEPGQFVMSWIPGYDQKPFSIGYDDGKSFGLTIFAVGPHSKKKFELKVGNRVGITGPYGHPFSVKKNTHYVMVAGGYGAGPLAVLAERLAKKNSPVDFCIGARNKDLLLFEKRVSKLPHAKLHVSTDDGSKGYRGFVTDLLEMIVKKFEIKNLKSAIVCTVGPELMEKKVLDICNQHNVPCEISIERYMKCGFGVCGSCVVDDLGIPLCTVGPVVNRETANKITEFGTYHRDKAGVKHPYV